MTKVLVRALRPHGEHATGDTYETDAAHAAFLEERTLAGRADPEDLAPPEPEPAEADEKPRKRPAKATD